MASEIKGQAKAKKSWHGQRTTVCSYCGGEVGDDFFFNLNDLSKSLVCTKCARKVK